MRVMSQNTKETPKANANTKRSRWKFFPKDRKSTEPEEPEPKPTPNVPPPATDSTYGSSGPNSAQPSDNENSTHSSLTIPQEPARVSSVTPPPGAQPGLLNPRDALTKHHDTHHSNPDVSVTSPTIRKETRHDPSTGNVITIVTTTTTTTTTTTVTGPNGTTVIEEPAELGDGRRTPEPRTQSEAVTAAINGQGDGSLHYNSGGEDPRPVPGQWIPYTPGRRAIPQRESTGSVTDLSRLSGLDDYNQPAAVNNNTVAPNLPPRLPNKTPLQNPNVIPENSQPAPMQQNTAVPALPPRGVNRKPLQSPSVSSLGGSVNGENTPISPQGGSRNFSYPSKPQSQSWAQPPQPGRPDPLNPKTSTSKLANLKMAAAGLHGAGEALRGTISQSADTYIRAGKVNEDRMAKHQEVINRGRYEIENRKFAPQTIGMQNAGAPNMGMHNPGRPNMGQQSIGPGPEQGRFYLHDPAQVHSFNTPQPDSPPTHVQLARRRLSGGYDVRPIPKEEPAPVKTGIGRWLHKSKSHPSDKEKDEGLRRPDAPLEPANGKLRRRSKQQLAPVKE